MDTDGLEAVRAIISHPLRLRIVEEIAGRGERVSPSMLAPVLDLPVPNVSYHVRKLYDAGVLRRAGRRNRRGAIEHFYAVTPKGLAAAREYAADLRDRLDELALVD